MAILNAEVNVVADTELGTYAVVWVTLPFARIFSPSLKTLVRLSKPDLVYLKYNTGCSVVVAASAAYTSASTPLVKPVIIFPLYWDGTIVSPANVEASFNVGTLLP